MMSEVAMPKEMKKRHDAMVKRLEKIGGDNPVVKKAIANQNPRDPYEDFEVVHELVSAAYSTYCDSGNLKKCMVDLGNAIIKAAGTTKSKSSNDDYED